jgi:hypothetical protein
MASIKKIKTLIKENYLMGLSAPKGLAGTMLIVGSHGTGKSFCVKEAADEMGGYEFVIECGSIGEKEVSGLPFAAKAEDGSTEVQYVKHNVVARIERLQKFYYEKALKEGFLGGTVKLEIDKETGDHWLVVNGEKILESTVVDRVVNGEDNRYAFGEKLPADIKMKLIESGEIKPVLVLFDEMNRADNMIMREFMNIILNRNVSGYDLPWWADITAAINPCSQNSIYATNELDPAQLDRFIKIKADAKLDEWINYELEKGANTDVIEAIAVAEGIFIHKDSSTEDQSKMTPSPRSWDIVGHIYSTIHEVIKSKFFTAEERKEVDDDLRILVKGKVGEEAGRTLLETIARKENNIKPVEILNGKSLNIDKDVLTKWHNQKRLVQAIISDSVANYLFNNFSTIEKKKTSKEPKEKQIYMNFMSQLKEFASILDPATQRIFVSKLSKGPNGSGVTFFIKIASAFSTEVLNSINETKAALKNLTEE